MERNLELFMIVLSSTPQGRIEDSQKKRKEMESRKNRPSRQWRVDNDRTCSGGDLPVVGLTLVARQADDVGVARALAVDVVARAARVVRAEQVADARRAQLVQRVAEEARLTLLAPET